MKEKRIASQNFEKSSGITLVALVVTIIVLLILAGVTISIALGNNGIIDRARQASSTWENATMNEEKMMEQFKSDIDTLTGEMIIKDSTGKPINLADIKNYYGSEVEYNEKIYQLFYVDTSGKYGAKGTWLQLKDVAGSYQLYNYYTTDGIADENAILWKINPDLNRKYGQTIRGLNSWDDNIKAIAALCNTTLWNTENKIYVPATDEAKGAFVIGGVSAEMFFESYNQARESTETQFEAKAFNLGNSYGYLFKPGNSNSEGDFADSTSLQEETDRISTSVASGMYRISNENIWIASPSNFESNRICYINGWDGFMTQIDGGYSHSIRPVVFLPSEIPVQLKD